MINHLLEVAKMNILSGKLVRKCKLFLCFLIIFLAILTSCHEKKKEQLPENLISEKQLIPLLIDIHFMDAYMTLKMNDSLKFDPRKINNAVFTKHNVTREKFSETIQYYSKNPAQLDSLYDKILARMSEMKAELTKKTGTNNTNTTTEE